MAIKQLAQDLHIIPGLVNVYLLETANGLALLDTGFPGNAPKILEGMRVLGRRPSDVRHMLLSHAHPDHIGSAVALKRETGAMVWAHPTDAPIIEAGTGFRSSSPHWVYAIESLHDCCLGAFALSNLRGSTT